MTRNAFTRAAKQYFYTLERMEEIDEDRWEISFMTSDEPDGINADGWTPGAPALRRLFSKFYGKDAVSAKFEFEQAENFHGAFAASETEAKRMMAEIAYVLEAAGMKPIRQETIRQTITPVPPMPSKKFYYTAPEVMEESAGEWSVVFSTSDRHRNGNDSGGTPGSDFLGRAFESVYGPQAHDVFQFEMCENSHAAFCTSRERAEQLAGEIVHVLNAAGGKPMAFVQKDAIPAPRAPQP